MRTNNKLSKISDEELVLNIVNGENVHLFEILYDRYASLVYFKCISFVKCKSEAEDLTQDIFIKLFVVLKTFKGNSKFSTWLSVVTYNYCLNYITRYKIKSRSFQHDVDLASLADTADDNSVDEELFSITANKLKNNLDKIHIDEKKLLLMRYEENLSIKEIMKITGLRQSAVKMRIHRAKQNFIKIYNDSL